MKKQDKTQVQPEPAFYFRNIKNFNDACLLQGTSEEKFNERFGNLGLDEDTVAYERLKLEIAAINNDPSFPNWKDINQEKWAIGFWLSSDSVFFARIDDCAFTGTLAGSRLIFKSKRHAKHAFETFKSDFKKFIEKKI